MRAVQKQQMFAEFLEQRKKKEEERGKWREEKMAIEREKLEVDRQKMKALAFLSMQKGLE